AWTVLDPDGGRRGCGSLDRRADLRRLELARPDVRERHAERGQTGGEAVGHGQGKEVPAGRERIDRDLAPGDVLLDQDRCGPGGVERDADGLIDFGGRADERQPALSLPVRRLDHAGKADAPCSLAGLAGTGADL